VQPMPVRGESFGASYVGASSQRSTQIPDAPGPKLYTAPDTGLPNHNPTIQAFVREAPPMMNEKVKTTVDELNPMDLNQLLQGGTFMEYPGSLTAPPCAEIVTWFVRREPVMCSDKQVIALYDEIMATTAATGNARSTMPMNGRTVRVRQAVREEPVLTAPDMSIPLGPNPRTDREFRAMKWAKDAMKIATASQDYVRDLDNRLRNAAIAHANALAPDLMPEAPTKEEQMAKLAALNPPATPIDMAKTAETMAKAIATAAKEAINDAAKQISVEARAAAASAAKEATKMAKQGMPPMPAGAPGGAPAR